MSGPSTTVGRTPAGAPAAAAVGRPRAGAVTAPGAAGATAGATGRPLPSTADGSASAASHASTTSVAAADVIVTSAPDASAASTTSVPAADASVTSAPAASATSLDASAATSASASVTADASPASAPVSSAAASSPREPGRRLSSLARAARETAFACREAARAAGSAFRAARGGARPPAGDPVRAPGAGPARPTAAPAGGARPPAGDPVRAPGAGSARPTAAPAGNGGVAASALGADGRAGSGTAVLGSAAEGSAGTDAPAAGASAGARASESRADSSAGTGTRRNRPYDTGYRPRSLVLRRRARDVAELVRAPAALTVPGDVLAGALAAGRPAGGRTLLLVASSVSLYWAGMALNDWADREEDAEERPERPVPSGRIPAAAAFGIAAGLTAAGLGLGALAGGRRVLLRRTLPLAAAVWAYDLGLKRTPLGPAAMAAARALDVLHGTGTGPAAPALGAAATAGLHTWGVTRLSRHEVTGEAGREPLLALAVTAATALAASGAVTAARTGRLTAPGALADPRLAVPVLAAVLYATSCARPQWAALRHPGDPARVRTAVGAGIHALLPLQAALVARAGAPRLAVALAAGLPQAARLARKVSPT
ncbi:SCO3242 family prenyltransferase [Streptomyces collinus]|nr:UbiA family prenyltransferase [Streptomyces collinus]UJA10221.1 Protoheme IX farnesyltransferase [Streptomyces collinus]UJA14915.1 Protoheme IX farnesyltransferase [Streptomyces collinus]